MIPMRLERAVLHTGSSMISRQKRPSLILTFPNRSTYPARVPRVETIVAKSATWARVPLPARIVITPGSSRSTPRSAFQLEQLTRNSARRWKVMFWNGRSSWGPTKGRRSKPPRRRAMLFADRFEAGLLLASKLGEFRNRDDVVVLALPRGGVPVGYEVANALHAPLDVFVVRKLGVPGQEELAMGALASGGVRVLNEEVVRMFRLPEAAIEWVAAAEQRELERREREYR